MNAESDISWERAAAFIRQHTHDVCNGLNSLDLEASLLQEIVADAESDACVARMRQQVRSLAEQLRSLSSLFQEPKPRTAPVSARELLGIWRESHRALPEAPIVGWVDELGGEKVDVDVSMMAAVFRELLKNAAAFSPGSSVEIVGRIDDGKVVFELREPKTAEVDTQGWEELFRTTRRGAYGAGLWTARRLIEANGAQIGRCYLSEGACLTTRISLPTVE